MLVIGLGHQARRGKNTAAEAIIAARGTEECVIKMYGFGDALKREVNQAAADAGGMKELFAKLRNEGIVSTKGEIVFLDGWVEFDENAPMDDPLCPFGKHRKLLQWWGSEYRRQTCSPYYWVNELRKTIAADNPNVAIIIDTRFKNEFLWVKANGGVMINVLREGFEDESTNPGHYSEHELDDAPYDASLSAPFDNLEELKTDAVKLFDMVVAAFDGNLTPIEQQAMEQARG